MLDNQDYGSDSVWLGDLAGFTVEADDVGTLTLEHRCGWSEDIGPADHFLANIAARAVEVRKRHRCEWPAQSIPNLAGLAGPASELAARLQQVHRMTGLPFTRGRAVCGAPGCPGHDVIDGEADRCG